MNRPFSKTMFAVFAVGMLSMCGLSAEPVAPLPDFNDASKDMGLDPSKVRDSIPTKASVGVPIYPGAFYLSVFPIEGMYPTVNLVTEDSLEDVREWYEKNLDGWTYDEMFELFAEGDSGFDFTKMGSMQTITLLKQDVVAMDMMFYDLPEITTRIQISYKPKE